MERLKLKLVKWLANRFGYKIAMYKVQLGDLPKKAPTVWIGGDQELLAYVDKVGYLLKKEPLKRVLKKTPDFPERELIKPLAPELVKELLEDMDPELLKVLKSTKQNYDINTTTGSGLD